MRILSLFKWLGGIAFAASVAQAQFTYTFDGSASDTPTATGLTFSIVETPLYGNLTWSTSRYVYQAGFSNSSSLVGTDYVTLTVTVQPGYVADFTALSFGANRSGSGPTQVVTEVRLNGASQEFAPAIAPSDTTSFNSSNTYSFDHSDLTSVTATGQVEYRFYGYLANSTSGTLRLDNIMISAAVSAIPEPSTYAGFAGLAILGFAAYRCRRRNGATRAP